MASGEDFPDALSAATLAAKADIPVLLTRPDRLPGETSTAIEALAPDQVIAIGGSAVLSEAVREDLDALVADSPWPEDLRLTWIAGSNRYDTSRQTAGVALDGSPTDGSPVVLTTGEDFPDALAAGALAARVDGYLLLTRPDRLSDEADDLIRTASDWFGSAIVVGGSAAVDDFVLEDVGAALAGTPRPVPPDLRLPPVPPPELDPQPVP